MATFRPSVERMLVHAPVIADETGSIAGLGSEDSMSACGMTYSWTVFSHVVRVATGALEGPVVLPLSDVVMDFERLSFLVFGVNGVSVSDDASYVGGWIGGVHVGIFL